MDEYLESGIKEVLEKYPELAQYLKEYDIDCYKCDGNCSMRNIFEAHNLSMKEEMDLASKMKKVFDEK